MIKKKKKIIVFIVVLIILNLLPIRYIVFYDKSYNIVKVKEIKNHELFTYSSIHSVTNTPLIETIEISHEKFVAQSVFYIDQGGAGLPEYPYGKAIFEKTKDGYIIKNLNRVFEQLSFRINEKYDNKFEFSNEIIIPTKILDGNGVLNMKVYYSPLIFYIFNKLSTLFYQ